MSKQNNNVIENKSQVSGIYKIENLINHKVYIGQSKNIYARWKQHKRNINNPKYTNIPLYLSMRKYGLENFSFEIIKETYDRDYWEIFLIQIYHSNVHENGYNISKGGDVGWKYVNELIKSGKLRKPSEYRVFTKESIEKMRLAKLNKKISQETREKMSKSQKKLNENESYRKSKCCTKNMTIEELNNFKLKERLSSKKRHVILCIETNEIFNSERELSKILNITRNKVSNILKNKTPYNNLTYIIIQ